MLTGPIQLDGSATAPDGGGADAECDGGIDAALAGGGTAAVNDAALLPLCAAAPACAVGILQLMITAAAYALTLEVAKALVNLVALLELLAVAPSKVIED
jgi:hypothetical protein